MCELLVGLPDVNVLGIDDEPGEPFAIHVECRGSRPRCAERGGPVVVKDCPVRPARGPAGVRPADATDVAKAPVVLSGRVVPGRLVH